LKIKPGSFATLRMTDLGLREGSCVVVLAV
jgi:hypothetical protein